MDRFNRDIYINATHLVDVSPLIPDNKRMDKAYLEIADEVCKKGYTIPAFYAIEAFNKTFNGSLNAREIINDFYDNYEGNINVSYVKTGKYPTIILSNQNEPEKYTKKNCLVLTSNSLDLLDHLDSLTIKY